MTTKITKDMLRVKIRNLIDDYINEIRSEGVEFPLSYRSAQGYCFFNAWLDVWNAYKDTEAYSKEFRK